MKHTPRHARRPGAARRPVTARIYAPGEEFPPPLQGRVPEAETRRIMQWGWTVGALSALNHASLRARFRVDWHEATGRPVV